MVIKMHNLHNFKFGFPVAAISFTIAYNMSLISCHETFVAWIIIFFLQNIEQTNLIIQIQMIAADF